MLNSSLEGPATSGLSVEYLETTQHISQALGLDLGKIIEGYPMEYEGITFWLQHYGEFDPNGMVLMIEIGALTAGTEMQICRQLLEYNYMTSAGLTGYSALMPGSDILAHCIRIDLEKAQPNAAEAVFNIIETMAAQKDKIGAMMEKEMEKLEEQEASSVTPSPRVPMAGVFLVD